MKQDIQQHPGSFRDPAGFVFRLNNKLYRQVNKNFSAAFDQFENSRLAKKLLDKGWLLPWQKINDNLTEDPQAAYFLQPREIGFISYPYEWSFDMLRDAALLTLEIASLAVDSQFQLKDATPYNIQWQHGKPVLIDHLSFEPLRKGPWIAYRQFCESFLAPLLLMHYKKQHLPQLFLAWPEGIPLTSAAKLLPWRSRFSIHTYLHIHMQAKLSKKTTATPGKSNEFGTDKLKRIFLSLKTLVQSLQSPAGKTEWADYYDEAGKRGEYLQAKEEMVRLWLREAIDAETVLDLGANEGLFTKVALTQGRKVIAADIDPECINRLYLDNKKLAAPLFTAIQDLAWPSPGMGANNLERAPFLNRARADISLALALIHHLALQKKMSFEMIRDMVSPLSAQLIIEFVPAEDEKAALLLQRIEGLKPAYSQEEFESCFLQQYQLKRKETIKGSVRTLYWFTRK